MNQLIHLVNKKKNIQEKCETEENTYRFIYKRPITTIKQQILEQCNP